MSDAFWRRLSYAFGLIAVGVLFGITVFAANVEIKDLDLWLHLKMGQVIMQTGFPPPHVDILSCSIAGKPWVNHSWLFQVLVYDIFKNGGAQGLIFAQVLIVTFTLAVLLLMGYQKDRQFASVFVLLLVMLVYKSRFTMRPDIVSLLFFALFIYLLAFCIGRRFTPYALFAAQVLWVNTHGFFFFGPLLVAIGILSEFLKRRVKLPWEWNQAGRLNDEEFAQLKKIFIFVILACLLNPQTFKGAWYPIGVLLDISSGSRIFFKHIQELAPPIHLSTLFTTGGYLYYKLLILLSFFCFIFNRRNIDIGELITWLVFLIFSLSAMRNIVFFAFTAYLVCMTNISNLSFDDIVPITFDDKKFKHICAIVLKIALIAWMAKYAVAIGRLSYYDFDTYQQKSELGGISKENYPYKAADFLVKNNVKGNFFNDFNSGAYLIGRCYPNIRVFIDGRTEVYGPQFFKNYRKMWDEGNKKLLDAAIDKYNITGALLNSIRAQIPDKTLKYFYNSKEWVPVYFDYDAMIFLKKVPKNKKWIDEFAIDFNKWQPPKLDLTKIGTAQVIPIPPVNRAYSLKSMGLEDKALEEAAEAVKISPGYIESYKIRGEIYGKRKEYEKAFENFRIAGMIASRNEEIRLNLGLAYEKIKKYEEAIDQYRAILEMNPKDLKARFLMARAFAYLKKYDTVMRILKDVEPAASKGTKDFEKIADIISENGNLQMALQVYTMALKKKASSELYNKMGLCFLKMKDREKAKGVLEKGLSFFPDDKGLQKTIRKYRLN